MGWVDAVPRSGGVHIGGLHALYQREDLIRAANITHIVSVLDVDIYDRPVTTTSVAARNSPTGERVATRGRFLDGYTHLQIRLEDDPNEVLLVHFAATNAFIAEALAAGAGVFVHCAMGKSRSATVVCAFLMWRDGLTPEEALAQVCEGRPVCAPNAGFMEQLEVYYEMLRREDAEERDRVYRAWLKERFTGDWWTWEKRRGTALKLKL